MYRLFFKSIYSRLFPFVLIVICLAASITMLLSIERVKNGTKESFSQSISGVDTIIGPRGSALELVLYSVFHVGNPTNNITYKTFEDISKIKEVDWIVPIALGDSYKGYRVIATNTDYFKKIKHSGNKEISLSKGSLQLGTNNVVIGSELAKKLNLKINQEIFITHGQNDKIGNSHDDYGFQVSGILKTTGTPIDKALFISLEGYELVHLGWKSGRKLFSIKDFDIASIPKENLKSSTITAAFVGLKSKITTFKFTKKIRDYKEEPISAVIPGIALAELWSIIGIVDKGFDFLSWLIIVISLIAMITLIMTSLESRKREMMIYRANGASPVDLSKMVILEAALIGLVSIFISLSILAVFNYFAADYLNNVFGVSTQFNLITPDEALTLLTIFIIALISSFIPAIIIYRKNLNQSLS